MNRVVAGLGLLVLVSCAGKKAVQAPELAATLPPAGEAAVSAAVVNPEPALPTDKKTAQKEAPADKKDSEKAAEQKTVASVNDTSEPGSLWTAASHWNNIFSLKSFRRPGDSILVNPTEAFRNKLARLVASAKKDDRSTPQFEERNFMLTVREIEEAGSFKLSGSYGFLFAGEPVSVEVTALVREHEIQEDDSVSSDSLLKAELSVVDTKKAANAKSDSKSSNGDTSATGAPGADQKNGAEKTTASVSADGSKEKTKIIEKVKDPNTEAAKRKRRAIKNFEKEKGTRVAKSIKEEEQPSGEED